MEKNEEEKPEYKNDSIGRFFTTLAWIVSTIVAAYAIAVRNHANNQLAEVDNIISIAYCSAPIFVTAFVSLTGVNLYSCKPKYYIFVLIPAMLWVVGIIFLR